VVVIANKQPLLKASKGGVVVMMENKQPPSKTSASAHFRGWVGGGNGKQITTIENKHFCSFLRVEIENKSLKKYVITPKITKNAQKSAKIIEK